MEVNKSYIEFMLKLLNNESNIDIEEYNTELTVNLYLTLLSLSNLEYSEKFEQIEKEIVRDFLTRLCNLKVKIQLKRKRTEINKLATELIAQYYENASILSIYIKDSIELENIINALDANRLTELIDKTTKDKMQKEDKEEERNKKRINLINLLPLTPYYIEKDIIYIQNGDNYEEITLQDFFDTFSYLLNPDNYQKIYKNSSRQRNHELIISNIIKTIIIKDKRQENFTKILLPVLLTYLLNLDLTKYLDLDTSKFRVENIKISELYSLASKEQNNKNTPKSGNIYINNEYFLNKLKDMIKSGMYYFENDIFVMEKMEKNTSDFKTSINIDDMKEFVKTILLIELNNNKKINKM